MVIKKISGADWDLAYDGHSIIMLCYQKEKT